MSALLADRIDSYGASWGAAVAPATNLESGATALVLGQDYVDLVFGKGKVDALGNPTTGYAFTKLNVECSDNPPTLKIWPTTIGNKSGAGARVYLNGAPDTGNFALEWGVI